MTCKKASNFSYCLYSYPSHLLLNNAILGVISVFLLLPKELLKAVRGREESVVRGDVAERGREQARGGRRDRRVLLSSASYLVPEP